MRYVILLRHGKAEAFSPEGDFARKLTDRGRRDSLWAGQHIRKHLVEPALTISSDAARALETARIVSAELRGAVALVTENRIYNATVNDLLAVINEADDAVTTLIIVGHNPGLEELVWALAPSVPPDFHLSTAAFATLETDSPWQDLVPGSATFRGSMCP